MEEDDFLVQAQRKAKQNFLREEIIQQDYSPTLFTAFCDQSKGANIDEWTFEELQECVRLFKKKYKPGQVEDEEEEIPIVQPSAPEEPIQHQVLPNLAVPGELPKQEHAAKDTEPEEEKFGSTGKPAVPNVEVTHQYIEETKNESDEEPSPQGTESPALKQDTEIYFTGLNIEPVFADAYPVTAFYLPESELSQELDTKVTITKFEVMSGGLLSSNYASFEITTSPFGWRVKRKEADFIWLKSVLQIAYPGYYVILTQVPPNPPKKTMNKLEPETLKKRQRFLQEFIESILRCELFKRSPIVVGFLREQAPKQFELLRKVRDMQQGSKLKKPVKLEDIQSITGKVMCNPTTSQDYVIKLNTFLTTSETVKKKLKRQTDVLMEALKGLSMQIANFAESVKGLSQLQEAIPEAHRHKLIYGELVSVLDVWSKHESEMAVVVDEAFNMFFKYRYNEMTALRDMIKEREVHLSTYLKAERTLKVKKEQLWQRGDVMKWDMRPEDTSIGIARLKGDKELAFTKMLYSESSTVQKLKDMYGYYNFQVMSEVERVMSDASEVESQHFNHLGDRHSKMMRKIGSQWQQLYAKTRHLYLKTQAQMDQDSFRSLAEAGERI